MSSFDCLVGGGGGGDRWRGAGACVFALVGAVLRAATRQRRSGEVDGSRRLGPI